jgi:hypothetical protein
MAGFWSGVFSAITGGTRGNPSGRRGPRGPSGKGRRPNSPPPDPGTPNIDIPPEDPDDPDDEGDSINPELEYWMALGANKQEAETLIILHAQFDSYPSYDNWLAYAEAQEALRVEPDWAEFREKYEGAFG